MRKHFHTIAVNQQSLDPVPFTAKDALVVYANHASWWDPLAALLLAEEVFPEFRLYAPIDKRAFEKYRMFGHMGFFPVEQSNMQGAKQFLRTSRQILTKSGTSIWLTPEGRFVDVRDTAVPFRPGLSHLAASFLHRLDSDQQGPQVWFVPAALEYTFWEERLPELLVWIGEPLCVSAEQSEFRRSSNPKKLLDKTLFERLRISQSQLAVASQNRDSSAFEPILQSSGKTFFLYDWMRRLRCLLTGKRFEADHSDKFTGRKP
jgi:1-acyl-sn-glycerol-3-phosphate acyltransferase